MHDAGEGKPPPIHGPVSSVIAYTVRRPTVLVLLVLLVLSPVVLVPGPFPFLAGDLPTARYLTCGVRKCAPTAALMSGTAPQSTALRCPSLLSPLYPQLALSKVKVLVDRFPQTAPYYKVQSIPHPRRCPSCSSLSSLSFPPPPSVLCSPTKQAPLFPAARRRNNPSPPSSSFSPAH